MADENPFAVSESCSGEMSRMASRIAAGGFWVDGSAVICRLVVTLPEICIYTGKTEDLVTETQYSQYPSMKLVLRQRSCSLTYFVHRGEKSRRALKTLGYFALGISGGVLAGIGIASPSPLLPAGMIVFIVAMILSSKVRPTLRLVRYEDSGIFRIEGFPIAYLQRLEKIQSEKDNRLS